ncbi:hypothetical protein G6M16_021270 [Agrobacterium tumefaciens]|nr:hypothetical protein G6M16_021270 [Agrobacterium tumefaciens]
MLYETWEVLAAIAYHERMSKEGLEETLNLGPQQGYTYFPAGRSAWHSETRQSIITEIQTEPTKAQLLEAKFAGGSEDFLAAIMSNYTRLAARFR